MLRIILAILAGFVVNFVLVFAAEMVLGMVYPVPAGVNLEDKAQLAAYALAMPLGALIGVVAGWGLGALGAVSAAYFISGRRAWTGWVAGAINLIAVVLTILSIPHPIWAIVAGVIMPIVIAVVIPILAPRKLAPAHAAA